jgi:hypothetical protein
METKKKSVGRDCFKNRFYTSGGQRMEDFYKSIRTCPVCEHPLEIEAFVNRKCLQGHFEVFGPEFIRSSTIRWQFRVGEEWLEVTSGERSKKPSATKWQRVKEAVEKYRQNEYWAGVLNVSDLRK